MAGTDFHSPDPGNYVFDSLAISKYLQAEGGYSRKQAEAHVNVLSDIIKSNLATKTDIEELRKDTKIETDNIRRDIEELRKDTKIETDNIRRDIEELRKDTKIDIEELRKDMKLLESRMTLRLGSLIVMGVTVLAVLMKVL